MAINQPGLVNGGFTVPNYVPPNNTVGRTNPVGTSPVAPSTTSLVAPTRPIPGTAPVGSQNYINYTNAMQQYGIQQLQQNAAAQGLPDPTKPFTGPYLTSNNPLAAQYGNSPLAKWLQVGNQAPGTWAAGMMYNGQPITQADADQLNRVSQEPNNPTWFNSGGITAAMQNGNLVPQIMPRLNNTVGNGTNGGNPAGTGNTSTSNNPPVNVSPQGSPYGAGYTGYGNTRVNSGPTPTVAPTNGPTGGSTGTGATPTPSISGNPIYNPGIPNGGFTTSTGGQGAPAVPSTGGRITQPSIPNGGFSPSPNTSGTPDMNIGNPVSPSTGGQAPARQSYYFDRY